MLIPKKFDDAKNVPLGGIYIKLKKIRKKMQVCVRLEKKYTRR